MPGVPPTSFSDDRPPVIFVMGPTASGKTELAVHLAENFPCEIISVDSALVYRGMDIGTAKPDAALLRRAPHRLIDICDPSEPYSAARFREDALREMRDIVARGNIPLLVGGTMLYFRALQRGLAPMPSADADIRRDIEAQAGREGWAALHRELAAVDPEAADRIHPNDPQRIQRALEVYRLTGKPMSALHRQSADDVLPYRVMKLALAPAAREILHARIEQRFRQMLANGLLEEVRALWVRGDLGADLPAIRAVGYRQVWEHLEGRRDYDDMIQRALVVSRQLAKRQLTWLRSEPGLTWLDSATPGVPAQAAAHLRDWLGASR